MNYLWEVLIKAKELDISSATIAFLNAENPSPYVETAFSDINTSTFSDIVEINPYYRFGHIFHELVHGENLLSEETTTVLFDILIHFIGELDVLQGLCKKEYYGLFLKKDANDGVYGKEYINIVHDFSDKEKSVVVEGLVKLYILGPSIELLRSILGRLFVSSMVYLDSVDVKALLIYIGKRENKNLQKQVQFIVDLFVPLDYEVELFWDMHFGIIGVEETMVLDDVMIY